MSTQVAAVRTETNNFVESCTRLNSVIASTTTTTAVVEVIQEGEDEGATTSPQCWRRRRRRLLLLLLSSRNGDRDRPSFFPLLLCAVAIMIVVIVYYSFGIDWIWIRFDRELKVLYFWLKTRRGSIGGPLVFPFQRFVSFYLDACEAKCNMSFVLLLLVVVVVVVSLVVCSWWRDGCINGKS